LTAPKLCIHPGLPKTGTTSLQKNLFPYFATNSLAYIGRNMPNEDKAIQIRKLLQQTGGDLRIHRKDNRRKTILLSDENISMSPANPWLANSAASPESIAINAARLARKLGGLSPAFLISIRRQDTWLASRYAESAKIMTEVSQKDFEQRVNAALKNIEINARLNWLRYDNLCSIFSAIRHAETLVLPIEAYEETPSCYANKLGKLLNVEVTGDLTIGKIENTLSTGPRIWRTKGHQESIQLTEVLSERILSHFRTQNEKLSERIEIDLSQWGYF